MKISDLIGDLSQLFGRDLLSQQTTNYPTMSVNNSAELAQVEPEFEDRSESDVMIPPLQQKIELLKKAVDVDNFYDDSKIDGTAHANSPINLTVNIPAGQSDTKIDLTVNDQSADDLDQIKKLAGVPVAAVFDAGDDEPLDS